MSKKPSNDIITAPSSERPAWLPSVIERQTGLEEFSQFTVPPRIKIVQPTSKDQYKDKCSPGDAILVPQMIPITSLILDEKNRPTNSSPQVVFTPLFFFAEYCKWNPLESRGKLPMIEEQSFDVTSSIAIRARDPKRRSEPHPDYPGKFVRFVEHLNFVVLIAAEGFETLPVLMSFAKGEHRSGTNFMTLAQMRRAPLFSMNFVFNTAYRTNDMGQWYGIDVANPPEAIGPFVSEEAYRINKNLHDQLKEAHDARLIKVEHDDEEVTLDGAVVANSEM